MPTSLMDEVTLINPLKNWYWWFAWYSVQVNEKQVWLQWVQRRIVYDSTLEGRYEYRRTLRIP